MLILLFSHFLILAFPRVFKGREQEDSKLVFVVVE